MRITEEQVADAEVAAADVLNNRRPWTAEILAEATKAAADVLGLPVVPEDAWPDKAIHWYKGTLLGVVDWEGEPVALVLIDGFLLWKSVA